MNENNQEKKKSENYPFQFSKNMGIPLYRDGTPSEPIKPINYMFLHKIGVEIDIFSSLSEEDLLNSPKKREK